MTQQEAFIQVYDMMHLIDQKGLKFIDSLEWRPEEQKLTYWGNAFNDNKTIVGFKTPFFDLNELTISHDPKASQVLIFKKHEILTYIVTSKEFQSYHHPQCECQDCVDQNHNNCYK